MQHSPYAKVVPDILSQMQENREESDPQQPETEFDVYVEEDRITFVKTTRGVKPTGEDPPPSITAARPFLILPLLSACLCIAAIIAVTIYSALNPTYERETLRLPAHFLPLLTFTATAPIIPTGVKTYPATIAHGTLTLTNGSVITEQLPAGMIFSGKNSEVQTDEVVTVPPGTAEGYGVGRVSAHAVNSGSQGNIKPLTIDQVYGTSLFIRNLTAFRGGADAYTIHYVTSQDKQTALTAAKALVTTQEAKIHAILTVPCQESVSWSQTVQVTSTCQFVAYPHVPGTILSVHLIGKSFIVEVVIVVKPKPLKRA